MTITTSDIDHAMSNSAFYYTFIGTKGNTNEYMADNAGDDRLRGATETWTFEDSADIGDFQCLRIRMEGTDGWHIDSVSGTITPDR